MKSLIQDLTSGVNGDTIQEMAISILEGFSKSPKGLPSMLFYDDVGSDLFKQIMQLDEYYPTRCEKEILSHSGEKIASYLKEEEFNLVELGCGDGTKTLLILNQLLNQKASFNFVPLDISKAAVENLIGNLKEAYHEIPFSVQGLVAEYFQGLNWLKKNVHKKNMILFLGSNIGNFNRPTSLRFLRGLWHSLNGGDTILIGFDLKKDLDVLYYAYNDSKGITKEFNFNVLDQINNKLGGNFKRKNFQHQGLYNVESGAMESYLISQCYQKVFISELDKEFEFAPWEPIHMEYSYKYLENDIHSLARDTGFEIIENFTDDKKYFIDSFWRVKK